jgi:hypothetical protein
MLFIQLLRKFSRVQLDSLEAQLRPVEQLDREPSLGAYHHGRVIDSLTRGYIRSDRQTQFASMPITLLNSQNNRRALSRG